MTNQTLLSIKISRRKIAAAVFTDGKVNYVDARTLSNVHTKAEESLLAFLNWIIEKFEVKSVGLELPDYPVETRTTRMTELAVQTLRNRAIPIWEVTKQMLFVAYAMPPLKTRKRLHVIVLSFWPHLNSMRFDRSIFDAAAVGYYVHVERLLHH